MYLHTIMPLLVEPRMYRHICKARDHAQRKQNGENLIRLALLLGVIFVLVQLASSVRSEKESTCSGSGKRCITRDAGRATDV